MADGGQEQGDNPREAQGDDPGISAVNLALLTGWIREFARLIAENAQHLTDLDAAIGDADHGINMDRGMTAVLGALDEGAAADMSALCKQVGMTLVKSVGG